MHMTLVAARQTVVSHVDSPMRAPALGPDSPNAAPDTVSTRPSSVVTTLLALKAETLGMS